MALEFMDGLEDGAMTLWHSWTGATVIAARTGHSGSYCLNLSGWNYIASVKVTARSEYYFSMHLEITSQTANHLIGFCKGPATRPLVSFGTETVTGYATAIVYGNSVVQTATVKPLIVGNVYLLEGYIKVADSGGRIVLYIDDPGHTSPVLDYTGDTKPTTDTDVDFLRFGYFYSLYSYLYIDDLYVDTADYPGNVRIQAIVPSGAGTTTEWDPSAGNNWDCVEERPPSSAQYVSTNTINEIDTYAASNLTGSILSIKAVQLHATGSFVGTPSPKHVQLGIRSNGTNYFSADMAPPLSPALIGYKAWETDPGHGDIAWTEANVNALEIGLKATA